MRKAGRRLWVCVFPVVFLLASCGYRLGPPVSPLPAGAGQGEGGKRIAVPVFENLTFEPLLEQRAIGAVKEELIAQGWGVVNSPERADVVLKGKINGFDLTPLSLDSSGQVLEYRVRLAGLFTLESGVPGRAVWKESPLEATAEFFASADAATQRTNEDRAIREASRRLAILLSRRLSVVRLSNSPSPGPPSLPPPGEREEPASGPP
jgi:outer membrane lipopolysaccharide assembly protein LptE/RlpB